MKTTCEINSDGNLSLFHNGELVAVVQQVQRLDSLLGEPLLTEFWNGDERHNIGTAFLDTPEGGLLMHIYQPDTSAPTGSREVAQVIIQDLRCCEHVLHIHSNNGTRY